jgi:hypothetical protein
VGDLEGAFEVATRKLDLSSEHGKIFWSDHCECYAPQTAKEAFESTERASGDVFYESAWLVPVPELLLVNS